MFLCYPNRSSFIASFGGAVASTPVDVIRVSTAYSYHSKFENKCYQQLFHMLFRPAWWTSDYITTNNLLPTRRNRTVRCRPADDRKRQHCTAAVSIVRCEWSATRVPARCTKVSYRRGCAWAHGISYFSSPTRSWSSSTDTECATTVRAAFCSRDIYNRSFPDQKSLCYWIDVLRIHDTEIKSRTVVRVFSHGCNFSL